MRSTGHDGESFDAVPEQKRQIGTVSATFLIVNRMVGSGIFATPSSILKSSGSVGLALFMWLLGAVIASTGLAVYIEWGTVSKYTMSYRSLSTRGQNEGSADTSTSSFRGYLVVEERKTTLSFCIRDPGFSLLACLPAMNAFLSVIALYDNQTNKYCSPC